MIIVLLLFLQSICLYCQRLVLHVHDRWINPKNVRLLTEAAESNPKLLPENQSKPTEKRAKKRYSTGTSGYAPDDLAETCRFCANTPQGYCRHHFHLQELQLQKQQRSWNPLAGGGGGISQEYRQLRKINRELKRNLKNRLTVQQQQQQQQQPHQRLQQNQQQELYYRPQQDYGSVLSASSGYNDTCESIAEYCNYGDRSVSTTLSLPPYSSATSSRPSFSADSGQDIADSVADSGFASTATVDTNSYSPSSSSSSLLSSTSTSGSTSSSPSPSPSPTTSASSSSSSTILTAANLPPRSAILTTYL